MEEIKEATQSESHGGDVVYVVVCCGYLGLIAINVFVVPKFARMFRDMVSNEPLPLLTQISMAHAGELNLLYAAIVIFVIVKEKTVRDPRNRRMINLIAGTICAMLYVGYTWVIVVHLSKYGGG